MSAKPILLLKSHPVTQAVSTARKPVDLTETENGLRRNPGEPDAQQSASSEYRKPRMSWRGLTIAIENPAGSVRRGRNRHGVTWEQRMAFDYGEIEGTLGVDGDPVDVFIGPMLDTATMVYVVHQRRVGRWDEYDEDKCMAGFDSEESARAAFLACYSDPRFLGPVTAMPVDEFVAKVRATRDRPAMIKAADGRQVAVLLAKANVGPYLRRGRLVNLSGYDGRTARGEPSAGQVDLFGGKPERAPAAPRPNPFVGRHPVDDTPDLFDGRTPRERAGEPPRADVVTEPRADLVAEHKRLVQVLLSPSHADDLREAEKQGMELEGYEEGEQAPAPTPTEDPHPSKPTRSLLNLVPEDKRAEWLALHSEQHELHHYEMGQLREQMERARSARNRAETPMREMEATARSLRRDNLPGSAERAEAAEAAAEKHRKAYDKHREDLTRLANLHQSLYERVADMGRKKNQIAMPTGDMDIDWAAMRKRTGEEQQAHEKSMLKLYREHYKAADKKRKAVVFKKEPTTPSSKKNKIGSTEKEPKVLTEDQRNKVRKSAELYAKYGNNGEGSRAAWSEKVRSGEFDHLWPEFVAVEEGKVLLEKERKKAKNDAWREKNLPRLQEVKRAELQRQSDQALADDKAREERRAAAEKRAAAANLPKNYLSVPFDQKDEARSQGALWDPDARLWYVQGEIPEGLRKFSKPIAQSPSPKPVFVAPVARQSGSLELPKTGLVSENDPSIYGHWLLGYEGEPWARVRQLHRPAPQS